MFNRSTIEIQQTQGLAFDAQAIADQQSPCPRPPCCAKVGHVNMVTGGTLYVSVPDEYDGPCSISDISTEDKEVLAVLPTPKEARMAAVLAISPVGGYSEVLVEITDAPVTHESYVDWL